MTGMFVGAVIHLEKPWPKQMRLRVWNATSEDLRLEIWIETDGRLSANVYSISNNSLRATTYSSVVVLVGEGSFPLILTANYVTETNTVDLRIGGQLDEHTDETYELRALPPKEQMLDETLKAASIAAAEKRRRSRIKAYRNAGVTEAQLSRRWQDLAREQRLLSSSLSGLIAGDRDQYGPVALHLRKLIGDGTGNHLLQDCAALQKSPLIVWEWPPKDPNAWSSNSLDLTFSRTNITMAAEPTYYLSVKSDLDCWLSESAGIINSLQINNADLLKTIADKIGSHVDINNRDLIDALEEIDQFNYTALADFLHSTAHVTLDLTKSILANRDQANRN